MKSRNKTLTKIIYKEIAIFFFFDNKIETNKNENKTKIAKIKMKQKST
jgi:hypothetical protein